MTPPLGLIIREERELGKVWIETTQPVSDLLRFDLHKILRKYIGTRMDDFTMRAVRYELTAFVDNAQFRGILWYEQSKNRWRYIL